MVGCHYFGIIAVCFSAWLVPSTNAQFGEIASLVGGLLGGAAGPSLAGAGAAAGATGALGNIGTLYNLAQTALQLTGTGVGILNQASEGKWFGQVAENAANNQREFQDRLLSQGAFPHEIPLTSPSLLPNSVSGGGLGGGGGGLGGLGGFGGMPGLGGLQGLGGSSSGTDFSQLGTNFSPPGPDDYDTKEEATSPQSLARIGDTDSPQTTTDSAPVTLFPPEKEEKEKKDGDAFDQKPKGPKRVRIALPSRTEEEYYDDVRKELDGDVLYQHNIDEPKSEVEKSDEHPSTSPIPPSRLSTDEEDEEEGFNDAPSNSDESKTQNLDEKVPNLMKLVELLRRSDLSEEEVREIIKQLEMKAKPGSAISIQKPSRRFLTDGGQTPKVISFGSSTDSPLGGHGVVGPSRNAQKAIAVPRPKTRLLENEDEDLLLQRRVITSSSTPVTFSTPTQIGITDVPDAPRATNPKKFDDESPSRAFAAPVDKRRSLGFVTDAPRFSRNYPRRTAAPIRANTPPTESRTAPSETSPSLIRSPPSRPNTAESFYNNPHNRRQPTISTFSNSFNDNLNPRPSARHRRPATNDITQERARAFAPRSGPISSVPQAVTPSKPSVPIQSGYLQAPNLTPQARAFPANPLFYPHPQHQPQVQLQPQPQQHQPQPVQLPQLHQQSQVAQHPQPQQQQPQVVQYNPNPQSALHASQPSSAQHGYAFGFPQPSQFPPQPSVGFQQQPSVTTHSTSNAPSAQIPQLPLMFNNYQFMHVQQPQQIRHYL